jgi:membrane associated rhomboid family serine protease
MMHASLSRKILIAIFVLFLLSWLGPIAGAITAATGLWPNLVVPGLELWRLVTYPIGLGGFLGLLIASICFGAPADEVEHMLGPRRFGILLLAVVVITGLLHLLLFLGDDLPLTGPLNLALFVLVGFVYLFPHSEVRLIFFGVRAWVLLTFILATTAIIALSQFIDGASGFLFLINGGYGALMGALYFHAKYQKYPVLLGPFRTVERMMSGRRSDPAWRPAPGARKAAAPQPVRLRMPFQKSTPREVSDEERLNSILDRINEKGYGDLSDDEKAFLRDYSGRM